MIVPNEPERSTKTRVIMGAVIAVVVGIVMVSVGAVIIQELDSFSPPKEFEVVDKAHIQDNWFTGPEQYRLYFNHDITFGYIIVNQTTYNRYQIGDWYNEPYQLVLYNAETPWGTTDHPTHDPTNPMQRIQP